MNLHIFHNDEDKVFVVHRYNMQLGCLSTIIFLLLCDSFRDDIEKVEQSVKRTRGCSVLAFCTSLWRQLQQLATNEVLVLQISRVLDANRRLFVSFLTPDIRQLKRYLIEKSL